MTIPKRVRDELQLLPGMPVEFSVNRDGEVVLRRPRATTNTDARRAHKDRFDAVRGEPVRNFVCEA